MTVIAADTFTRANISANASIATGWGTPSDGTDTSWNALSVTGSPNYAITSNVGTITNSAGGNSLALGTGTADGEAVVEFQTTATAAAIGLMLRCDAGGTNRYQCRQKAGNLHLEKVVSGTATDLVTQASFTVSTNTNYWLKLRIVGSNLYAKVWAASGSEPSTWTLTATDSTYTSAGRYGLIAGPTATGQTISYSNYQLSTVQTGGGVGQHKGFGRIQ